MALLPDNLDFSQSRCTVHESTLAGARSFICDNGVLRLSLLPEHGGRLCSLFYRPLNLELLATEFVPGALKSLFIRGGWCAAFPSLLADGEVISHVPWEVEILEQRDARVTLRLCCEVDRASYQSDGQVRTMGVSLHVERFVRLVAGEPAVTVEDVIHNRGAWPVPATWAGMVSLRAQPGDRAVLPVERVEVQRGVGPVGNELDFGLLVTTPYQAMARDLREGWLGLRLAAAPVDLRLTFPHTLLPHAVVIAQRDEEHPAEDSFRFQPLATAGPIASDARDDGLRLPPQEPVRLPLRLEVGGGMLTGGAWSRPGLQLAQLINAQKVPPGRLALWRVGEGAAVVKTPRHLLLLLPEFDGELFFGPEDLPGADLILFGQAPPRAALRTLIQRSAARFIGPAEVRQMVLAEGVGGERAIGLSPGARVDLPGLGVLATPARGAGAGEQLGFLLQVDHLTLYHTGPTAFLGEFGPIGEQFHPQLVLLPLSAEITLADAVHAAKLLQARLVVPLGSAHAEGQYVQRCRAEHVAFATRGLHRAEGALFDGYKLSPLE